LPASDGPPSELLSVPVQIRRFRGGYIFFKENPAWGRLFGVLMLLLSLVLFAFARDNSVKGNRSVWLIASAIRLPSQALSSLSGSLCGDRCRLISEKPVFYFFCQMRM